MVRPFLFVVKNILWDKIYKEYKFMPSVADSGDYYFFFDQEWKYGLFGHPWRGEIVVIGQELIDMFECNKQYLGIG